MASEETYPLTIDYLPNEYLEKAEKELHETPENSVLLLEELKLMAKNEKGTKDVEFLDDFLRQFLRHSKYDVPKSLKRLQDFIKFRRQNEKIFKNVEDIKKSIYYQLCTPLPWRCREGCTIVIFEYGKWDPSEIAVEDLLHLGIIMYQQSLRNPVTQINGFKIIVDWKGSNLKQLRHTPPTLLFSAYKAFETCSPARTKEVHYINESPVMRSIWTFIRPILSEKLRKRVFFHSSPEDLLTYFPKHILPVRFGGDLENYYMADWMTEANQQQGISMLSGQCNNF